MRLINTQSFYIGRIDLTSKLRKVLPKWRWSHHVQAKNSLTDFQTLTHQIILLAGLHTLSNLFHYKTKKTTYSTTLKTFFTLFLISPYFVSNTLKILAFEDANHTFKILAFETKINLFNQLYRLLLNPGTCGIAAVHLMK